MASTALVVGIAQVVLVEQFPKRGIVLVEEILFTDTQPIHAGTLLELGDQFGFKVVIDCALALVHAVDGRREQTYIVEIFGLIGTDVERVIAAHRQSSDGTVTLSVTAAEGFLAGDVIITTAGGDQIEVQPGDTAGTYSFVMPASDVLITAAFTEETPEFPLGDVNKDGNIDVDDVTALILMVLGGETYNEDTADMSLDGFIDVDDVTALINIVLGN